MSLGNDCNPVQWQLSKLSVMAYVKWIKISILLLGGPCRCWARTWTDIKLIQNINPQDPASFAYLSNADPMYKITPAPSTSQYVPVQMTSQGSTTAQPTIQSTPTVQNAELIGPTQAPVPALTLPISPNSMSGLPPNISSQNSVTTGQPSPVPTTLHLAPPTSVPTKQPTLVPTRSPTKLPTRPPTKSPTVAPTARPTVAPSLPPTANKITQSPTAYNTTSSYIMDPYPWNPPPSNPDQWYYNYDTRETAKYGPGYPTFSIQGNEIVTSYANNGWPNAYGDPNSYWIEFTNNGWGPWKGALENRNPLANICNHIGMQSPIDLVDSGAPCEEHHQVRSRVSTMHHVLHILILPTSSMELTCLHVY